MSTRPLSIAIRTAAAVLFAAAGVYAQSAAPQDHAARVDEIFKAHARPDAPGCAVGVSRDGRTVLSKAYGMADLEHDVPNRPDTIFEAGSVSKQFTAAAVLLLAQDGKISLDDPVRKYIPELPDYGAPLTVRHMLQHTSGLRDWGEVASIAGWPRTSRVHTHAHVLDIVSRQKALNFTPGTRYSYSNTGYNLAAILVSRVSGQPFASFSEERIFRPLGMTSTSWRDDYTRIVRNRAIAYSPAGAGFRQNMPFENVHGNGGLLTTVGDLLKWNQNFVKPLVGDAAFLKIQQDPGTFADGKPQEYAMGLSIGTYKGVPEVSHSGSTAGYRAHLTRYPSQQNLSVAVLCNTSAGNATRYALAAADLFLGSAITADPAPAAAAPRPRTPFTADPKDLAAYAGRYYSDEAEVFYDVVTEGDTLVLKRRPDTTVRLRATARDHFDSAAGTIGGTLVFVRDASGQVTGMSWRGSRVFDLRFRRVTEGAGPAR